MRDKITLYFKNTSILISIVAIIFFVIFNSQKCHEIKDFEKIDYLQLFKYNYIQSDLNLDFEEISIFPEYNNISCLGQINNLDVEKNQNNLLYSENLITLKIFTSTKLKSFIYALLLTLQIINLKFLSRRDNQILSFLYSVVFNLYFFAGIVEFLIYTTVGQIVIYSFHTNVESLKKVYSLKLKKFIFPFFSATNLLILIDMIYEKYFFIDSYLLNYKFGFMRRGLVGNFILFSPFSTLLNIVLICCLLILLYSLFLYWTYSLLKKTDDIYLYFIAFSPLIFLYQLVNTTNSVNSNLMGGEFLGLVTVSYAAYAKDKLNFKNLTILLFLFTFSLYVHEINLLTIFVIHIILKNKFLLNLNLLSASIFLYFYILNYSEFVNKFDLFCKQFLSLNIRKDICLGGLSNATSDQVKFGLDIFRSEDSVQTLINSNNLSYIISILFFVFFARNLNLSNKVRLETIFILFMYFPLFLIAVDWGRWLYVIFSLLLILFLVNGTESSKNIDYLDIFVYLAMVFALRHFGTRGISLTSANFLLLNNCYFLLPILFKNFIKK